MWYTVRDNIMNENIIYDKYEKALAEALERLELHRIAHAVLQDSNTNVYIVEDGHNIIICELSEDMINGN